MNLSCLLWHTYGRWSNFWCTSARSESGLKYYRVWRSRKCSLCGWQKDTHVYSYTALSKEHDHPAPTWDEN